MANLIEWMLLIASDFEFNAIDKAGTGCDTITCYVLSGCVYSYVFDRVDAQLNRGQVKLQMNGN